MAGISLKVSESDYNIIVRVAKELDLPPSTWIKKVCEAAVKGNQVGSRDLPVGQRRISLRLDGVLHSLVEQTADSSMPPMRITEWIYNAVLHELENITSCAATDAVNNFFSAKNLGYNKVEYRKSQHLMALQMATQLSQGEIGLNEASTGTGKSLAILVAATSAGFHLSHQSPIVIATATRVLQAQLSDDIVQYAPLFKRSFGRVPNVQVLYGKANYISPTLAEPMVDDEFVSDADKMALKEWLHSQSKDGHWLLVDLAQCVSDTFPLDAISVVARQESEDECPYILAKERAKHADIIITSHHMLLISLKSKNALLHNTEYALIDEAHSLENSAESVLSMGVSLASVDWGLKKLRSELHGLGRRKEIVAFTRYGATLGAFHSAIRSVAGGEDHVMLVNRGELHLRAKEIAAATSSLSQFPHLPRTVKLQGAAFSALVKARELADIMKIYAESCKTGYGTVACTVSPDRKYVSMITSSQGGVRNTLKRILWDRLQSVSVCSATLSTQTTNGASYADFVNSIGLQDCGRVHQSDPLYNQWLYDNVEMHLAPSTWVAPESECGDKRIQWLEQIAAVVNGLTKRKPSKKYGGILVLCTSYSDIEELRVLLGAGDRTLIAQERGGKTSRYIDRFVEADGKAVMLGLGAMWTGIDLKGHLLTDLVITRLPILPSASGGLFARFQYLKKAMGAGVAFSSLLLPRAKVTLRQGVGRLIRCEADRGRVYICDSRVLNNPKWSFQQTLKSYKPFLKIKVRS